MNCLGFPFRPASLQPVFDFAKVWIYGNRASDPTAGFPTKARLRAQTRGRILRLRGFNFRFTGIRRFRWLSRSRARLRTDDGRNSCRGFCDEVVRGCCTGGSDHRGLPVNEPGRTRGTGGRIAGRVSLRGTGRLTVRSPSQGESRSTDLNPKSQEGGRTPFANARLGYHGFHNKPSPSPNCTENQGRNTPERSSVAFWSVTFRRYVFGLLMFRNRPLKGEFACQVPN